ncbi:MAG: flagellar motor protein MotB [Candidatus Margulisiibacteriota bacterium]
MSIKRNFEADEAEFEADQFRSSAWAVNLADLMTFLMIFFLLMFSFYFAISQGSEHKARFEKSLKSIERQFSKKDFKAARATVVEPAEVKTQNRAAKEADMIDVRSVSTGKELFFLYRGKLSAKDTRDIVRRAYLASKNVSSQKTGDVPALSLATDEVAAYVVNQIIIPAGIVKGKMITRRYVVAPGDSIWKICVKYNLDPEKYVARIVKDNDIGNPGIINAGETIKIITYPFTFEN